MQGRFSRNDSQNPLFAASMAIQDMVGHSPEVHGVNVLHVHDINQVPDELLRNRGSSSHYRQGSLSDLVRQYGDPSDTAELEFGTEVMGMGPFGNNDRSNTTENNADDYDVIAALGASYIQRKHESSNTLTVY